MFASNAWFSIKVQLRVSIAQRFDTAGLTNGKIILVVLAFCLRDDCRPEKLSSDNVLLISCLG